MNHPNAQSWSNLWQEDASPERIVELLLRRLSLSQSINADQIARLCLTPQELAGLLPAEIKADHALHTAESLAWFLEDHGDGRTLAGAIRDWKVSIEMTRSRFGWLEFPPAIRKRAHQRAQQVLAIATERGWIEMHDEHWVLTPQGRIAAQELMG
jgi:hypothetical protein